MNPWDMCMYIPSLKKYMLIRHHIWQIVANACNLKHNCWSYWKWQSSALLEKKILLFKVVVPNFTFPLTAFELNCFCFYQNQHLSSFLIFANMMWNGISVFSKSVFWSNNLSAISLSDALQRGLKCRYQENWDITSPILGEGVNFVNL